MAAGVSLYCEKCKRTMKSSEFYASNNFEKYPAKKLQQCRKCITMHVNNFQPETYLWILQECDVPYVPKEWNKLLAKYGKDPSSLQTTTIIGRYLSVMKLTQYKDCRWKDNEFLQELERKKVRESMELQGFSEEEIQRAILELPMAIYGDAPTPPKSPKADEDFVSLPSSVSFGDEIDEKEFLSSSVEDYFAQQSGADEGFENDLTEEDKIYLRLKWGKTYKPEEWVKLEQLYSEMMESYDIQTAGHVDTLKLICKTSLKANQLIDIGDVDGFQKMSKVYDNLMKSGKFTAQQNKSENGEFIDSLGELIELCEKQGYIERYYIEQPNDKIDLTIQDMQRYTRTLIERETDLTLMVEKALKDNEKEDQEAKESKEIVDLEDLSLDDLERTIKDADFEDFENFLDEEADIDLDIENLLKESDI